LVGDTLFPPAFCTVGGVGTAPPPFLPPPQFTPPRFDFPFRPPRFSFSAGKKPPLGPLRDNRFLGGAPGFPQLVFFRLPPQTPWPGAISPAGLGAFLNRVPPGLKPEPAFFVFYGLWFGLAPLRRFSDTATLCRPIGSGSSGTHVPVVTTLSGSFCVRLTLLFFSPFPILLAKVVTVGGTWSVPGAISLPFSRVVVYIFSPGPPSPLAQLPLFSAIFLCARRGFTQETCATRCRGNVVLPAPCPLIERSVVGVKIRSSPWVRSLLFFFSTLILFPFLNRLAAKHA